MRLVGRVFRSGRYWAIEVPMLGVVTQGSTKKDARSIPGKRLLF